MRTYFFKNPWWLSRFYHKAIFQIQQGKTIYLTFDDGPTPEVTPWVLSLLDKYNAKATFFCIGRMAEKYPEILNQVIDAGHAVGGHTYRHLSGWKLTNDEYFEEVEKGMSLLPETKLFRPPYGQIRLNQLSLLNEKSFQTIMWSHLSGDFDGQVDLGKSMEAMKAAAEGSILVFHDSTKGFKNLKVLLPQVLDHFSNLRYSFKAIDQNDLN